jgi:hypothetical protein
MGPAQGILGGLGRDPYLNQMNQQSQLYNEIVRQQQWAQEAAMLASYSNNVPARDDPVLLLLPKRPA